CCCSMMMYRCSIAVSPATDQLYLSAPRLRLDHDLNAGALAGRGPANERWLSKVDLSLQALSQHPPSVIFYLIQDLSKSRMGHGKNTSPARARPPRQRR